MKEPNRINGTADERFHIRQISVEDALAFDGLGLSAPAVYRDPFRTERIDLCYADVWALDRWRAFHA